MAKTSSIQRNLKRIKLVKKFSKKRKELKKIIKNKNLPLEERLLVYLHSSKRDPNWSQNEPQMGSKGHQNLGPKSMPVCFNFLCSFFLNIFLFELNYFLNIAERVEN